MTWMKTKASMFMHCLPLYVAGACIGSMAGCRKAPMQDVPVAEWRVVLNEALHDNPPGSPHFNEGVWRWSGRLFQRAAASKRDSAQRALDRHALIEWAVLACYVQKLEQEPGAEHEFAQNDQELMASARQHALETFGQPTMASSWDHFAALWKDYGMTAVESPFAVR